MKGVAPVLMAGCLAACGGADMSDNGSMNPATATSAAKADFTTFTEKLIRSQSETGEPVAVAAADFYFPDDDNESAFAAVVPAV
jgi:hypothetical protein